MTGKYVVMGLTYFDKIGRVLRQSLGGFFKLQASL